MDFLGGLADRVSGARVSYEDAAKSSPMLRQLAIEDTRNRLIDGDKPLVDSTLDMVPLGGAGAKVASAVDKAAVTVANKVPVYMYDQDTYKGLAKGLAGKKPVDVSDLQTWVKKNPEGDMDDRARYEANPRYRGYMDPTTLQYAAKDEVSKTHELQHVKDYLSGKPAGSSPGEMSAVIGNMAKYRYPEEMKDRMVKRLYQGNLGERRANVVSAIENDGLDVLKYRNENTPVAELTNREYPISDLVDNAYGAAQAGLANTITYQGLVNKRDLLGYSPHYSKLRPDRSKSLKGKVGVGLAGSAVGMEAIDSIMESKEGDK